jgi:hypothetical protein
VYGLVSYEKIGSAADGGAVGELDLNQVQIAFHGSPPDVEPRGKSCKTPKTEIDLKT